MKFTTTLARLIPKTKTLGYTLEIDINDLTLVDKINKICQRDKPISVEIKVKRKKRSLDANAYYWQLLHQIAQKMRSTDEEIHDMMLRRYGTFEYIAVTHEVIEPIKRTVKIVEEIQAKLINGKPGVILKLIRGSHTYNTKEFSILIDGLISECKALGIETMTPDELAQLKASYVSEYD